MAAWLFPAMAAAGQALSTGLNWAAQGNMNRKTRRWNEAMMNKQRAWALEDYSMINAYNSPTNQMKLLKEAGMNPALAYQTGTMDAAPVKSTDAPSWDPKAPRIEDNIVGNALSTYQNLRMQSVQMNNIEAATEVSRQEAILKAAQTLNTIQSTDKGKFELGKEITLFDTVLEAARLGVEQQSANIDKTKADTDLSRIGFDSKIADIGHTRASTQAVLDNNERQAALAGSTLRESAEKVLTYRLDRAKTEDERARIRQELKILEHDEKIKQYEVNINKYGMHKNDPFYWRALQEMLERIRRVGGKK